jgi:sigma-B regulation protein RsbU (phosphoserine phosphatase)
MSGARSAAVAAARPMRILVVDDLEINRDLLTRRVQRLGHEAGVAVHGRDALVRLREGGWDLVLLDITMPEMDGYETLQHIRADPALQQLPVVMVSAIDETDSVVRCLELGADDYLTKPFNPLVLQARVEASLAKKRLLDQQAQLLQALSREMEIGQRIQQGFLPAGLPVLPGWGIAAFCKPARRVGGDFYDAYLLPGGLLALTIADVCDKGVGAALYMALFRTLLRVTACERAADEAPAATLQRSLGVTNDYIATVHGGESMFATVFFAIVDTGSGLVHYANAGHEPPLLRQAAGPVQELPVTGPALGLVNGQCWAVGTATMGVGDSLLSFTDGITEALGDSAAQRRLLQTPDHSVGEAIDALRAMLDAAAADQAADDATVLALKRLTPPTPPPENAP